MKFAWKTMRLLLVDTGHFTKSNQQRNKLRYSRCIVPVPGTPGLVKETLYLSNSSVKLEIKNQKMVYHKQNIVLSVFYSSRCAQVTTIKCIRFFPFKVWHNPFLAWNKSEFGGIKSINVKAFEVWTPDIYLYNK